MSKCTYKNQVITQIYVQALIEYLTNSMLYYRKRKLTAVCSHQTRIGNLDAHLI